MRLGIIGRADEGGLGVQTLEYARHLDPERVLVVDLDPPRGEVHPERFLTTPQWSMDTVKYPPGEGDPHRWREFVRNVDVILTAESTYLWDLPGLCAQNQTKLVVHANPELYADGPQPGYAIWAPTSWELHRLPHGTPVVPVPVDRDRCARRTNGHPVRVLVHVSAPAMLDRNGSDLVKAAITRCRERFDLLVVGPEAPLEPTQVGKVRIHPVPAQRDYWRIYDGAQALVLPRRYGGLCLPMQEAASMGLPIVAMDADANAARLEPDLLVGSVHADPTTMRGGSFSVHQSTPEQLALVLDRLVSDDELADRGRWASEEWAAGLDWSHWAAAYRDRLGYIASGAWPS